MMRVLVVGDSCQDVFVYGDITRISPEAPIPVFVPTHTEKNDGMARNVSHNVESLEMHITTLTNKNGIPDLIAIPKDSKVLFSEIKTEKGKLSKLQEYRLKELNDHGIETEVYRG